MTIRQTEPSTERFLADVAQHELTILRDDGLFRHLRFAKPTRAAGFELVTWPGYLCITGSMGTYVFSRIDDMFDFFRSPTDRELLQINEGYWAEKLEATDAHVGHRAYSPIKFRERVNHWLDADEASPEVRQQVQERVLARADDGEFWAMQAAVNFEHAGFQLTNFVEASVRQYTYHFVWCCYAIVWGIHQYDLRTRRTEW